MYFAGIDIGSTMTKIVILKNGERKAQVIGPTGAEHRHRANEVMEKALQQAGIAFEDLTYVVATGYGRINVPFADRQVTEITCHAKGVASIFPSARTVIDIGGQDAKGIKITGGKVVNFVMNDKCAAGTGRFLEIMAQLLEVPLAEIGPLSLQATEDIKISSMCAVFAKSEAARHLRQGVSKANILGGLHASIAERVTALLKRISINPEFVISGGIAKNVGVVRRIEAKLGLTARISYEPQIIGAVGAAIFAAEKREAGGELSLKQKRAAAEAQIWSYEQIFAAGN